MKINTGTNKNQAQSRKFNIAHLTRNVSTLVFRGTVRILCAHLFTRVFELFQKRKCFNFQEMLSKKNIPLAWSRRGSKYTLRNWLRSVANRKTRISIRHRGIYIQVQSSIDYSHPYPHPYPWCYPYPCFSNAASTTKVALVKETKHKANPATDEVRVENRTMVLPDHKAAITKQFKLYSKAITKGGTTAPVKRLTLSLENTKLEFTESQFNSP